MHPLVFFFPSDPVDYSNIRCSFPTAVAAVKMVFVFCSSLATHTIHFDCRCCDLHLPKMWEVVICINPFRSPLLTWWRRSTRWIRLAQTHLQSARYRTATVRGFSLNTSPRQSLHPQTLHTQTLAVSAAISSSLRRLNGVRFRTRAPDFKLRLAFGTLIRFASSFPWPRACGRLELSPLVSDFVRPSRR